MWNKRLDNRLITNKLISNNVGVDDPVDPNLNIQTKPKSNIKNKKGKTWKI